MNCIQDDGHLDPEEKKLLYWFQSKLSNGITKRAKGKFVPLKITLNRKQVVSDMVESRESYSGCLEGFLFNIYQQVGLAIRGLDNHGSPGVNHHGSAI